MSPVRNTAINMTNISPVRNQPQTSPSLSLSSTSSVISLSGLARDISHFSGQKCSNQPAQNEIKKYSEEPLVR